VTLTEANHVALMQGCELEPIDGGSRFVIRAINYDADPYEIDLRKLLGLSKEEFIAEWIPPRFET